MGEGQSVLNMRECEGAAFHFCRKTHTPELAVKNHGAEIEDLDDIPSLGVAV